MLNSPSLIISPKRGNNSSLKQLFVVNTQGKNDIFFPKDIQPVLQNIVSTSNLGCQLELRQIAL